MKSIKNLVIPPKGGHSGTERGAERERENMSKPLCQPSLGSERFILFLNIFIYLLYFWLRWVLVAVSGLFSSCGERGLLFVAVRRLLIVVASLVVEHGL